MDAQKVAGVVNSQKKKSRCSFFFSSSRGCRYILSTAVEKSASRFLATIVDERDMSRLASGPGEALTVTPVLKRQT